MYLSFLFYTIYLPYIHMKMWKEEYLPRSILESYQKNLTQWIHLIKELYSSTSTVIVFHSHARPCYDLNTGRLIYGVEYIYIIYIFIYIIIYIIYFIYICFVRLLLVYFYSLIFINIFHYYDSSLLGIWPTHFA